MKKILSEADCVKFNRGDICKILMGSCQVWPIGPVGQCGIGMMAIGECFEVGCGGSTPSYLRVIPESTTIEQNGSLTYIQVECNNTWRCY